MYTGKAVSSTPRSPLNFSGKNNKRKVLIVSLFIDIIAKTHFLNFNIALVLRTYTTQKTYGKRL